MKGKGDIIGLLKLTAELAQVSRQEHVHVKPDFLLKLAAVAEAAREVAIDYRHDKDGRMISAEPVGFDELSRAMDALVSDEEP